MNQIIAAQEAFNSLPSDIRKKFDNDPAEFLEFVSDEKNNDEMIQMGLKEESIQSSETPTNLKEDLSNSSSQRNEENIAKTEEKSD